MTVRVRLRVRVEVRVHPGNVATDARALLGALGQAQRHLVGVITR